MQCPKNYQECENYRPKNDLDSKCVSDSTFGVCVKEHEAWEREVDDYFQEYDKSEIIC
ncbi:unnamed protein product [marine sediment metagenome]|uniref:Uncharacterized protein n=1 Tax=marine sediment metagenome TaxID=412755 RepID=X1PZ27_9ZZZZ